MKYMVVYVEAISAEASISDGELSSAVTRALSDVKLKARDGCVIGHVVHAQVTEGPKPTNETAPHV